MAGEAQKLARAGEITGEAALTLIIWPNRQDMLRFVERAHSEQSLEVEELNAVAKCIADPDVELPSVIRLYHSHLSPLPGMCHAFIKQGPRWMEPARCSRRARIGNYCRAHAKQLDLAA